MRYFTTILLTLCTTGSIWAQKYTATISTSMGDITVELSDLTPKHRDNFVILARSGFYDSVLFHRTIKDFMIQAGDQMSKHASAGEFLGDGGATHTIMPEIRPELRHKKGVIAAARMPDDVNPNRESSGSQFYITVVPTTFLDDKYTIFGTVIKGQDVADKISLVATDKNDRPKKDIRINKITINETKN